MNDTTEPSGRFVLRIDRKLHAALRESAKHAGLSLNEFCARKLASPTASLPDPLMEAVRRAAEVTGQALVGVVAFGSWARDQAGPTSDLDLLVPIEREAPITRDIYHRWDAFPALRWERHRIEPHFAHLPEPGSRTSGLWAEVAVDGIVLFERGLSVSRYLVEVRREIAAGRIVRREAHGQPYWIEAA